MEKSSKEFKAEAREKLKATNGRKGYGTFLLGLLVHSLMISFCIEIIAVIVGGLELSDFINAADSSARLDMLHAALYDGTAADLCKRVAVFTLVSSVIVYFLFAFVTCAQKTMALAVMRGGLVFSHCVCSLGNTWRMLKVLMWQHTFVFLWSLLFIIPGIRALFSYVLAPYLQIDNPDWSALQCISASKRMMDGHRWRFFCLCFSFIFLNILAFCLSKMFGRLPYMLINPYMETSFAAFYEDMVQRLNHPHPGH